jgi:hypothetical protein
MRSPGLWCDTDGTARDRQPRSYAAKAESHQAGEPQFSATLCDGRRFPATGS